MTSPFVTKTGSRGVRQWGNEAVLHSERWHCNPARTQPAHVAESAAGLSLFGPSSPRTAGSGSPDGRLRAPTRAQGSGKVVVPPVSRCWMSFVASTSTPLVLTMRTMPHSKTDSGRPPRDQLYSERRLMLPGTHRFDRRTRPDSGIARPARARQRGPGGPGPMPARRGRPGRGPGG